jgi:hypothetical protein
VRGQDLNLRPLGYEPNELPDCSTPRLPIYNAPSTLGTQPLAQQLKGVRGLPGGRGGIGSRGGQGFVVAIGGINN